MQIFGSFTAAWEIPDSDMGITMMFAEGPEQRFSIEQLKVQTSLVGYCS